jgi:hypothetical protein
LKRFDLDAAVTQLDWDEERDNRKYGSDSVLDEDGVFEQMEEDFGF